MKKITKTHHKRKNRHNKTLKRKRHVIPSSTPLKIRNLSNRIAGKLSPFMFYNKNVKKSSYSPTINKQLVTLQSIQRENLIDCNIEEAYKLKEPLQIGIPNKNKCVNYYEPDAKKFLLHNLAADKHIDPKKIVPPIQSQSNCWFNAMFVTFFVSDKGRKFFHFLRQLMIEGKQKTGAVIPEKMRDAFALLNFSVDACLTGNNFAYILDTNSIIHQLYKSIPVSYKENYPIIVDVDAPGNPLLYYMSIINYLNDSSIILLFVRDADLNWKDKVVNAVNKMTHLPHLIVLEIYDEKASEFNKKPVVFTVNEGRYKIDSAVIRDVSKQHFCATITCEGSEMGYDGMSFHRLVPLSWKHKMNTNYNWQFEVTKNYDGTPLEWNFTKCYQLLMYYRID